MSWPKNPGYKQGDACAICDICGFKYYHSQLRKRWDGMLCCDSDWDPRQSLDLIRVPRDNQAIPDPRPEAPDHFVSDFEDWRTP